MLSIPLKKLNFESIIRNGLKGEVTAEVWEKGEKGMHGEQDKGQIWDTQLK